MLAKELRTKSMGDLQKELSKLREKLASTVREKRTSDKLKAHELSQLKKDIAKVLTVINEKQGEEK